MPFIWCKVLTFYIQEQSKTCEIAVKFLRDMEQNCKCNNAGMLQ